MLASSFMDPMLGIDIHWEMVPTPAPVPTPIPNPFTGIVFDPIGLAAGLAISNAIGAISGAPLHGPVLYWGVFPATNTGTMGIHIPGHILIPPGVMWAPVPKTPAPVIHPGEVPKPPKPVIPDNDAVVVFGSKTVTVFGSNAVRLGDIALSCSEPIRLPSTVVLAVPKGAPILIGGPMSLDIMAAVLASLRTRFIGDSLQSLLSRLQPSRFRSLLMKAACFLTGHPVDVASGKMVTDKVDIELPGPIPLKIERVYQSNFAGRRGPLGHGWSLSLDQAIWEERGKVVLLAEDGREVEFDTFDLPDHRMRPGDEIWHPIERLWLRCAGQGTWLVTSPDGTRREFAPAPGPRSGRAMIQRIVSRSGHHDVVFSYDGRGLLEAVRDSAGRRIGLSHDDLGRVIALELPREGGAYVHRRYEYDAEGDLVRVVDARGHAWSFEYVTHLMVRETDRRGLSFYFEYDGLGQDAWCTRTWGDGGIYDHVIAYDKKGHVTHVKDSRGHTTQYFMNTAGLVVKIVDPLGKTTSYEYDPRTLARTLEIDPEGHRTAYERDARGNVVRVETPDGAVTRFVFHERHAVRVKAVEPSGAEWRWEYDAEGQLTGTRNPDGRWTRCENEGGLLRSTLAPGGEVTRIEYDEQKGVSRMVTSMGAELRMKRDLLGRVVEIRNPRGGVLRRFHDAESNVVRIEEPHGVVRRFDYDPEGNLIRARDGLRDVSYAYTGRNRLHEAHEAGTTVRYHHDTEGHLSAVENQAGERYQMALDGRGLSTADRGFDGSVRRYELDAVGNVKKVVRASGRTSIITRDAMGRVTDVAHSDGTFERYRYRRDGALIEATNESAEVHFELDDLGRVVLERTKTSDGQESWTRSGYDAEGFRVRIEASDGHVQNIRRDLAGRVEEIAIEQDASPWRVRFERDPLGLDTARAFPGGVTSRWTRDDVGRPTQRTVTRREGEVIGDRHYAWEGDDRIRAVLDDRRGATYYEYDARGRLVRAHLPWGETQDRAMDAVGNVYRTPDRSDRTYGPGGRIQTAGGARYEHDADGKLICKTDAHGATTHYRWNGAGMLREVELANGKVVRFSYDALARRVKKEVWERAGHGDPALAGEVRWRWDGHHPVTEQGGEQGDSTWVFDPETWSPLAKLARGKFWGVLTDPIGTPTELVDEAGEIATHVDVDAFGAARAQGEEAVPFRWPGLTHDDDTGLSYCRHRYYDSDLGQFISTDPLEIGATLHFYAYPPNPSTWVDPLGLQPYDFATLLNDAQHNLDFATARDGAVFWSGGNMATAQAWAAANGKTTLEQTAGGRYLAGLNLFEPTSGLTGAQAAQVWDAASVRFAQGASGEVNVFSTGAKRIGPYGERTWWRIEKPALDVNPAVTDIQRRRKDGGVCGT